MNNHQIYFKKETYEQIQRLIPLDNFDLSNLIIQGIMSFEEAKKLPYDFFISYKEKVKEIENALPLGYDLTFISYHLNDVLDILTEYNQAWEIEKVIRMERQKDTFIFIYVITKSKETHRLRYQVKEKSILPDLPFSFSGSYERRYRNLHENALKHPYVRLRLLF